MAFFFPEWIPWWAQLSIVAVILIFSFFFLLMPFSVFGVKSRLSYMEHQLEEVQAQLRVLLKRTAEARERNEIKIQSVSKDQYDEDYGNISTKMREKNTRSSDQQTYAPIIKNRQTSFDPPEQENGYDDNKYRERLNTKATEQPNVDFPRRGREELYNPPSSNVADDEQSPRRRAEPILRWPQK